MVRFPKIAIRLESVWPWLKSPNSPSRVTDTFTWISAIDEPEQIIFIYQFNNRKTKDPDTWRAFHECNMHPSDVARFKQRHGQADLAKSARSRRMEWKRQRETWGGYTGDGKAGRMGRTDRFMSGF
ncbi:hypothetical protein [Candidatus Magnetaquiglobus chichijimensis]|uniref:hypothetical protein n=1 Tax=Candidatus Magnetaquiglobus chichijimensis TaxID=3141448 RepID=UPI003B97B313